MGWQEMSLDCATWPTPEDGCYAGCDIPADTDEDLLDAAALQAGVILRTLSGNQAGTCTDTVRPLPECAICGPSCTCVGAGDRIRVSSSLGPVTEVTEVTIDGEAIDEASWRFYPSSQLLYRVPPEVWPRRDRKWADCDEPDTMCVDVVIGHELDAWAVAVHAELTCEILKSCTGQKCRLPKNATNVVGQGVTVTLTPEELKMFIPAVAGWVAAVNPYHATQPARVYSPDLDNGGTGCGC